MGWLEFGTAAAGALSGGDAAPGLAQSDGGGNTSDNESPVSVNVGGLNVPAYPNFPRFTSNSGTMEELSLTGQIGKTTQSVLNNDKFYYLAGAVVLAALIIRVSK